MDCMVVHLRVLGCVLGFVGGRSESFGFGCGGHRGCHRWLVLQLVGLVLGFHGWVWPQSVVVVAGCIIAWVRAVWPLVVVLTVGVVWV